MAAKMTEPKQTALDWIAANEAALSKDHMTLWHFHEPAWREYKSAAWYVDRLRREGFTVEAGSADMPTAFCATYGTEGPVIGCYAEYDAVPGTSQDPVPYRKPRDGVAEFAAGHTDPHSALGMGGLTGALAMKAAIDKHGLKGRIKFFGEPAEKTCGSKPIHASHGYYDDLDAMISFHPTSLPALSNTAVWETHCGCYWSKIFTFTCRQPETWGAAGERRGVANNHSIARAPGAIDALCLMYTTTKYNKEFMLPHTGSWTLNEAIFGTGLATSDNLPPRISQIQYAWRCPTIEMAETIDRVLENNAKHVAGITHCEVESGWVTKTRPGLANNALAEITYGNFEMVGPPNFDGDAKEFGREILRNLGYDVSADEEPFPAELERLIPPREGEAKLRTILPSWQKNYTSDDYVDYTWHTPTVRLYVGRPAIKPLPDGKRVPLWCHYALGGVPAAMDPMYLTAGKVIATTGLELMTDAAALKRCQDEFRERTGGGIGGSQWIPPLLGENFPPPIHFPWPEYVETVRGVDWIAPRDSRMDKPQDT
ncbi:MAG: amidohydrolase [Alphaproteobacteria bacterium]|nr:amidohydrolase [Alphaproteobacteria bacterium]